MESIPLAMWRGFSRLLRRWPRFCGCLAIGLPLLTLSSAQAQTTNYVLGTTNLLAGPAAGTNSVVLGVTPQTATWAAMANANWLHLSQANQSGAGSTNVIFSYDANPGSTRSGTLTLAAQTLTITQAGSTYVAGDALTTLATHADYVTIPAGLAVDNSGNVFIADAGISQIEIWSPADNTVTLLLSLGGIIEVPEGVALDASGNTYIAASVENQIIECPPGPSFQIHLVTGIYDPYGVSLDAAGNVYIANTGNQSILELSASNHVLNTLVSSGLAEPRGVAVDAAGNVYISDFSSNALYEWIAASGAMVTLAPSGLPGADGLAVDGSGNVYVAACGGNTIMKWTAADGSLSAVVSGLNHPTGLALDRAGNMYISDTSNAMVEEFPRVFLDPTPITETGAAGSDALPMLLPTNINLSAPFVPSSDQPWLTLTGITNGEIYFSFPPNPGPVRTAHINVLGQLIPVSQETAAYSLSTNSLTEGSGAGMDQVSLTVVPNTDAWAATVSGNAYWLHLSPSNQDGIGGTNVVFSFDANPGYGRVGTITIETETLTVVQSPRDGLQGETFLGTTASLEGPAAGTDSVVLFDTSANGVWTASANADWLHLSPSDQTGQGSTNVIFSYDANPGATRSGTISVGGQMLAVTQAGSTYVAVRPLTKLAPSLYDQGGGMAVDREGDIYVADPPGNAVLKWTAANNSASEVPLLGLNYPTAVAMDCVGDLYIADSGNNAIKKWTAANSNVATLAATGLNSPSGVAVDGLGNVYIADSGNNAIKEWNAANSIVITLVDSGLNYPSAVAVDAAGNVYIADSGNNAIKEWNAANLNVTTPVGLGLNYPSCVAVDGAGNLFIADSGNNAIKKWTAADSFVTTLVSSGIVYPSAVAVDGTGNVYISDYSSGLVKELPSAYVDPTPKSESLSAGADALPAVLPATANLLPPFNPTSDQAWLTVTGITNDVVNFAFTVDPGSNRTAHLTVLGQTIPVNQAGPVALGTTIRLEGADQGTDSVVLAVASNQAWTAMANVAWLHLAAPYQGGTGNTNVIFSYDLNSGATRSGTINIAGQTLTVTQAGSTYVAARPVTELVPSGLSNPSSVALDGEGNVYFTDPGNNAIDKWTATNSTVTTLVSTGLNVPGGVAVDGLGNVYIADSRNNAIKKWTAANNNLTTLVATGLNNPSGVALGAAGNVYIADTGDDSVKEWMAASSNLVTLISAGLSNPTGVAADAAGNLYIADTGNNSIKRWGQANHIMTSLVTGLQGPTGVSVDGGGNVYVADTGNNVVEEWLAANQTATVLVSGLEGPTGVSVDGMGNVYVADTADSLIEELPYAFVDPTTIVLSEGSGTNVLPVVLPPTENLAGPFAPASDQNWLTILSTNGGFVNFTVTANPSSNRTAHVSLLGQSIAVTQASPGYSYDTKQIFEGPAAGTDSVVLVVVPNFGSWVAGADVDWLHLSPSNQNGTGSTNLVFDFDANPGPTRSGTISIFGQSFTVTQAGSTYVRAGALTTLVSSGLNQPTGVAVDHAGNVYIADTSNSVIKEWSRAANSVISLISSGLSNPCGVAVDGLGNVYIADTGNNAIEKWTLTNKTVSTLVSGLAQPFSVALDSAGDVVFADTDNLRVGIWVAASGASYALIPGYFGQGGIWGAEGVAVDGAGNVYIADARYGSVFERLAAHITQVPILVSSGLTSDYGVALDGEGNVYIADTGDNAIKKWTVATTNLTALVDSGLSAPRGVAVDGSGNVFIADTGNNEIEELPFIFVDATPRYETAAAGTDALPVVLPATADLLAPFAPNSDQPWLNVTGVSNGVVSFSFSFNPLSSRAAHITLFGQSIPITQAGAGVTAPAILGARWLGGGVVQFSFTNAVNATFTVVSSTNLSLPFADWTAVSTASNTSPGVYEFTSQPTTNDAQRFYGVRSP